MSDILIFIKKGRNLLIFQYWGIISKFWKILGWPHKTCLGMACCSKPAEKKKKNVFTLKGGEKSILNYAHFFRTSFHDCEIVTHNDLTMAQGKRTKTLSHWFGRNFAKGLLCMREEGAMGDKTQVPSEKYHHECIHNEKDRTQRPLSLKFIFKAIWFYGVE